MKTKTLTAVLMVALWGSKAFAGGPFVPVQTETTKLTRFEVDAQIQKRVGKISEGALTIDYRTMEARMILVRPFFCPEGRICAQVMPAPITVEAAVVSVQTDECGTRVITARRDKRMVDGGLEQLVIRDHRQDTCMVVAADSTVAAASSLALTEVEYTTEFRGEQGPVSTRSYFEGKALRSSSRSLH